MKNAPPATNTSAEQPSEYLANGEPLRATGIVRIMEENRGYVMPQCTVVHSIIMSDKHSAATINSNNKYGIGFLNNMRVSRI
jgi:hypothetical protein